MVSSFDRFCQYLHSSIIPELLCTISHLIFSGFIIYLLWKHRKTHPTIQNSPIITIFAQVILLLGTILLLIGKALILDHIDLSRQQNRIKDFQGGCFGQLENSSLSIIISLYTICIQFIYIAYLLKMVRVIQIITGKYQLLFSFFCSEKRMIIASFIWSFLIFGVDIIMKFFSYPDHRLHMHPQFQSFFCDYEMQNSQKIIMALKKIFYLIIFMIAFIRSYKLEQIDRGLDIRKQVMIILSLPYIIWITDCFMKIFHPEQNSAMAIHYMDCVSNLIATMMLWLIHLKIQRRKNFFLPEGNDLDTKPDFSYLLKNSQIKSTLQKYFESRNKKKLFNVLLKVNSMDCFNPSQEIINEIEQCIENRNSGSQHFGSQLKRFINAKTRLYQQATNLYQDWLNTKSGKVLKQKMQKNSEYYTNMKKLHLVHQEINRSVSQSFDSKSSLLS